MLAHCQGSEARAWFDKPQKHPFILMIMSNYDIALEVLSGKWGNGTERRERLTAAGYNYNAVQSIVNALVQDKDKPSAPVPEMLEIDYDPERYKGIQVNIII